MTVSRRPGPATLSLCALVVTLTLAACAVPGRASPASNSTATPSATATMGPSPTPAASGSVAGLPYDATAVLAAMRESRRPGGVPDLLETETVATAVAAELWTYDAQPWSVLAIGGTCGSAGCTLDVAGSTTGGGSDLYSFRIDASAGSVELIERDLHGYPPELEAEADAVVRSQVDPARLSGLQLLGMQWMAPPDTGRFRLAYRSGGEEGSAGLEIGEVG
jgi:hypothetical protein